MKVEAAKGETVQTGNASYVDGLYPNPALPPADQPALVLMAMCIFGEARGESREVKRAVAQVIVNRALHAHPVFGSQRGLTFHENLARVILKPCQFSCFLPEDPNYVKLFQPREHEKADGWIECLRVADEALTNYRIGDSLTHNSDHYFDNSIQPPAWADPAKETVALGRMRFFRLYLPPLTAGSGEAGLNPASRTAAAPPFPPPSSLEAKLAAGEASDVRLPASLPSGHRDPRYGLSRWLGGRELSTSQGKAKDQQHS